MTESDRTPAEVLIGYAQEELLPWWNAAVFLAGPTPRSSDFASWRPAAVEVLRRRWLEGSAPGGRLVVFVPEVSGGGLGGGWEAQVAWEDRCLNVCDVIAFWVPRDMSTLPGLTTNVEWGRWESSGKVVLGAPPTAPGMRYLRHYAEKHGVPIAETLDATMGAAMELLAKRLDRT